MKNIVIFYGGKSCESDISVITALSVYQEIKSTCHAVLVYLYEGKFFTGKRLLDLKTYHPFKERRYQEVFFCRGKLYYKNKLKRPLKIDCGLVCCHGGQGENGALSGLLEIADIPYTCCAPMQSAVCMDKVFTKHLLQSFHLPTLPFQVLKTGEKVEKLGKIMYPVIVKPASLGSSIGISKANSFEELTESLKNAFLFDKKVLIERALTDFNEYTCAVFESKGKLICSQIEEVVTPKNFYSFDEKYGEGETKRIYPADVPSFIETRIIRFCKKIYTHFDMKGIIRVDFLEKEGKVYINEINTIPGSLAWYLYKNGGYDIRKLVEKLVEEAVCKKQEESLLFTEFGSTVLAAFSERKKSIGKGSMKGK